MTSMFFDKHADCCLSAFLFTILYCSYELPSYTHFTVVSLQDLRGSVNCFSFISKKLVTTSIIFTHTLTAAWQLSTVRYTAHTKSYGRLSSYTHFTVVAFQVLKGSEKYFSINDKKPTACIFFEKHPDLGLTTFNGLVY